MLNERLALAALASTTSTASEELARDVAVHICRLCPVVPLLPPPPTVGIALSGLVFGLMVLFELRPAPVLAVLLFAAFAVFHGYAHGAERPADCAAGPAAVAR
jgi:hypothetical protein